jgi:hypothetical protein
MASIYKEVSLRRSTNEIWDAVRDAGAVHTRLARNFVTDCEFDGDVRVVTFANGLVAKERIVTIDDERRRLVYSVIEGRPTHHNGSFQVFAEGPERCRLVWIADLLPEDVAGAIGQMMTLGIEAIRATLNEQKTAATA